MLTAFVDAKHLAKRMQARRELFLAEMDEVVSWRALLAAIEPHYPNLGRRGRQPYPIETMLRIHLLLQQWCALSDPAVEEALHEIASLRQFARLSLLTDIPDETTGTIGGAMIIAAHGSIKNRDGRRGPQMHQAKKDNQWFFGLEAHIGADTHTGLVHTVACTPAEVTQTHLPAAWYGDCGAWRQRLHRQFRRHPQPPFAATHFVASIRMIAPPWKGGAHAHQLSCSGWLRLSNRARRSPLDAPHPGSPRGTS